MADVADSSKYDTIKDNIKDKINEMIPFLRDSTNFDLKKNKIFAYIDDVKPNNNHFELMDDLVELSELSELSELLHTSNSNFKKDILSLKEQLLAKTLMNCLLVKETVTNNAEQKAKEQQQQQQQNTITVTHEEKEIDLKKTLQEIVTLVENNNIKKVRGWSIPFSVKNTNIKAVSDDLKTFINSYAIGNEILVKRKIPVFMNLLRDKITSIIDDEEVKSNLIKKIDDVDAQLNVVNGGKKSKKLPKKEILGKMRCIYKIPGDRKEYLKHKGKLITVKEYKELMKAKPKKKEAKPKKVKKTKSKK